MSDCDHGIFHTLCLVGCVLWLLEVFGVDDEED